MRSLEEPGGTMRVDHLYVLSILASLDCDADKKLETLRTARALYDRHSKKAKTAALVEISKAWGSKFDSKVIETSGDNVPLGVRTEQPSPEKDKPTTTLGDKGPEGKKEQVLSKTSTGLYLVFHSDGGGSVLDPKSVANVVATVVPQPLHASITKISLFACEVAGRGEGDPIDKVIGLTMDEVRKKTKLIGGLQIMVSLLGDLDELGIRPMVCGYDIPVFAGEGLYKKEKPARGIKTFADNEWKDAKYSDPEIYGRKLVIYKDGRQSLATLKSRDKAQQDYKKLHKKVLRLNDKGQIAEALAGWSSKD
jgi:hypothetical protein